MNSWRRFKHIAKWPGFITVWC